MSYLGTVVRPVARYVEAIQGCDGCVPARRFFEPTVLHAYACEHCGKGYYFDSPPAGEFPCECGKSIGITK